MNIKLIETKRVLSPTNMSLAKYAINPYRGCEFGCLYCYSRLTKSFKPYLLGVKINAPDLLEKQLRSKTVEKVVLGSNCECFTYAERIYRITEKILTILNKYAVAYTILTKSSLVQDYLDLIKKNKDNRIFFTFNLSEESTKIKLESLSPSLKKRLKTLEKIIASNINLRLHIGPFIPYITDIKEIFKLFKDKIKEINIELYHSKMGNFNQVLSIIKNIDKKKASYLESIYKTANSYYNFSKELEAKIKEMNKYYNYKIYFIVPEFDKFYNSQIIYD